MPPSSISPAFCVPGSISKNMSLSPVCGPEQDRRVAIDRQEVAIDAERHDRDPVLELDVLDVADLDAGDAQRLALAGDDGLGGLELGLELEGTLLEDRDPQPLVLDDHVRGRDPDEQEQRDRDEVAEVLADRDAHPPPPEP